MPSPRLGVFVARRWVRADAGTHSTCPYCCSARHLGTRPGGARLGRQVQHGRLTLGSGKVMAKRGDTDAPSGHKWTCNCGKRTVQFSKNLA